MVVFRSRLVKVQNEAALVDIHRTGRYTIFDALHTERWTTPKSQLENQLPLQQ